MVYGGCHIPYIMGEIAARAELMLKEVWWNGHVLQTISK
jgi:hypothetical protein